MDSVIITYAVLDYSGKLMRRFFSMEEARALSDRHCNTHPVAIRREWWRLTPPARNKHQPDPRFRDSRERHQSRDWPPPLDIADAPA